MIELPCSLRLALRPRERRWEILDKSDWSIAGFVKTDPAGRLEWLEIEPQRRGQGFATEAFLRLAQWRPDCVPQKANGPQRWLRRLGYEASAGGSELNWSSRRMDPNPDGASETVAAPKSRIEVPDDYATVRGLVRFTEPAVLCEVGLDHFDRRLYLAPGTARAWQSMTAAASGDGVVLEAVSGFRSTGYQESLLARKLDEGQSVEQILAVNAAPGYSEHHTGRALDLTTADVKPLSEQFESTEAYRWLRAEAARFGFSLSYPRNNRYGFDFEPWHWACQD